MPYKSPWLEVALKARKPVAAAAPAAVIIECSDSRVTSRAGHLIAADPVLQRFDDLGLGCDREGRDVVDAREPHAPGRRAIARQEFSAHDASSAAVALCSEIVVMACDGQTLTQIRHPLQWS